VINQLTQIIDYIQKNSDTKYVNTKNPNFKMTENIDDIPIDSPIFTGPEIVNLVNHSNELLFLLQSLQKNDGDPYQTQLRIKENLTDLCKIAPSITGIKFLKKVAVACEFDDWMPS